MMAHVLWPCANADQAFPLLWGNRAPLPQIWLSPNLSPKAQNVLVPS